MAKLYLIPTPIGNLEDITLRAIRILKEVRLILAEDSRTTSVLLNKYDIKVPAIPYHQHNEHHLTPQIVERIANGEDMALVTDAGTTGLSDPGFFVARACIAAGVEIECLPGATAFVPALVDSGIPCNSFCFEGFLPLKKGRATKLEELKSEKRTMIFYESPFRMWKTLEQFSTIFGGDRKASVSRELSKMHEETVRGTLTEILAHYIHKTIKGEIVIVVAG